ncbi:heme A synthase, partial [bacterium]|nr:heme A synthase [bacterium]
MKHLVSAALVLAFVVVSLGAYVRLSDAGLGCPDWPGCYGHLLGVPDAAHEHAAAAVAFPGKPVEAAKAWKEMIHRYAAGILGLLILAIAAHAWRREER